MLRENERKIYNAFFAEIPQCLIDGSNDATISYLALAQGTRVAVVAARMTLGDDLLNFSGPQELKTGNVRAGCFRLRDIGRSVQDYLTNALDKGAFEIGSNTLFFPQGGDGGHGIWYRELSEEGLHADKRISVLSLFGGPREVQPVPQALDWELKAATPPFDGLEDLAQVYRFGPMSGGTITFDVVAPEALEVRPESTLTGDIARIVLAEKYKLNRSAVSLRLRVEFDGQTIDRRTVLDGDIEWESSGAKRSLGVATIKVLPGTTLHCTVVYAGRAQHERRIVDQSSRKNTLRMLFEVSDPNLKALKKRLESGKASKTSGRDLEPAIAWLLGMLGFEVLNLGSFSKSQDGVDVVARCPSGGVLLIECTTDILREEKTGKLLARVAKLKEQLAESDLKDVPVLPLMLTTASQNQVEQQIASTERTGVLVMTGEQVDEWVDLSAAAPNADREFVRLSRRLADAQSRMRQLLQAMPDATIGRPL